MRSPRIAAGKSEEEQQFLLVGSITKLFLSYVHSLLAHVDFCLQRTSVAPVPSIVEYILLEMNCAVGQCLAGGGGINFSGQRRSSDLASIFSLGDMAVVVFGILKSGCHSQLPSVDY